MTINNSYIRRLINLVFELKEKGYKGIAHLTKDYFLITLRLDSDAVVIDKCITGTTKISEVEQLIKDLEQLNK